MPPPPVVSTELRPMSRVASPAFNTPAWANPRSWPRTLLSKWLIHTVVPGATLTSSYWIGARRLFQLRRLSQKLRRSQREPECALQKPCQSSTY